MIYRTRTEAIHAENAALDDIARCNRALDILKQLTMLLQAYPRLVVILDELTQLLIAMKHAAMRRRAQAAEQL
jgi:hypothetical protein